MSAIARQCSMANTAHDVGGPAFASWCLQFGGGKT